ncbi:MAG: hypothetical protein AAFV43_05345 [Planctomycetota bacterium]
MALAFVAALALVGWVVGARVKTAWLKWTVFLWSIALMDLGVFGRLGIPEIEGAVFAVVLGQMAFLTVWSTLGDVAWVWRLPAGLLALTSLLPLMQYAMGRYWGGHWLAPLTLVVALHTLLCWRQRRRGERLTRVPYTPTRDTDERGQGFRLIHAFIWSLALSPLLVVARDADWPNWAGPWSFQTLMNNPLSASVFVALHLVGVRCVLWLIVGGGHRPVRLAVVLLALALVVATLLGWSHYELSVAVSWWNGNQRFNDLMIHMHGSWPGWFVLAYGTFAALQLFFRASGYRLRETTSPPTG